MPSAVRACPDHECFEGDSCPVCGATGQFVTDGSRRRQLSKFISGALRHFPEDAGLELDRRGWTTVDSLVAAVEGKYDWADRETVDAVVATDPKGRFERDGERIRAAYGHSVDVDLESGDGPIPDRLYHGTAPRTLDSILAEGLRPMSRQQVHLSGAIETAREVGRRHADSPVVLAIDAAAMERDGHDITKRGTGTYTVDRVPPDYVTELDGE